MVALMRDMAMVWKENNHIRIRYFPKDKKSWMSYIGREKINDTLNQMRKDGWTIVIRKPETK